MNQRMLEMSQGGFSISVVDLVLGLVLASLLGLAVALVYRWTHRGFHYERSFLVTLMMLPQIVAVVMMLIGSNLALSLGMVGALSIIRFRTVIKDSRDMVFLFLSIAVGLGCGTYNWMVILVTVCVISAVLIVLHFLKYGSNVHAEYVLVINGQGQRPSKDIKDVLKRFVDFLQLRSLDINEHQWELVYELRRFKGRPDDEGDLLDELHRCFNLTKTSLLAPQLSLPV